jgi:cytochrome P450
MTTLGLRYDPLDFAVHCDPYPWYRELRAEAPLYHNADRGFWALSRHDDVVRAGQDWQRFSSARQGERSDADLTFGIREVDYIAADSDRHLVMRRILQPVLSAGAIARLEPSVRTIAEELVAPLAATDRADFVPALARPLPATVLCHLLGFPAEDAGRIDAWNRVLWGRRPDDVTIDSGVETAEREMREHLTAALARAPEDSVMRALGEAERAGTISRAELLDIGVLLIAAGMKTTAALIGTTLHLLAAHPDQQAALAAEPALISQALEEALRYDSPTQWFARVTTTDVATPHGTIPRGERVLMLFGSANRDERRHADPDVFDIRRAPRPHLSFGHGIHHCVGAALARLEARVCLEVVLARLQDLRPAGTPERTYTPAERDLASLPLAYRVSAAA